MAQWPSNKGIFLNCILPAMNDFNKLFQADVSRISYLLPEVTRILLKLIKKSKADVRKVKFELVENQYDDDLFAVGVLGRTLLTNTDEPIEEAVQANLFSDIHKFYCAVVWKIIVVLLSRNLWFC